MAKRLTDSRKWDDDWFIKLESKYQILWIYILDKCSHIGIYKPALTLAGFCTHYEYIEKEVLEVFKERLIILENGLWFVPKFLTFQYGSLKTNSSMHRKVVRDLQQNLTKEVFNKITLNAQSNHSGGRVAPPYKERNKDKEKELSNIGNNTKTLKPLINTDKYIYLNNTDFNNIYESYLKSRKKKASEQSQELILKELHKYNIEIAIKMLEESIKNGWTGIFPLKTKGVVNGKFNGNTGEDKFKNIGTEYKNT